MDFSSKEYKASWIASFKYKFDGANGCVWKYNKDGDEDWTVSPSPLVDRDADGKEKIAWQPLKGRLLEKNFNPILENLKDENGKKIITRRKDLIDWIPAAGSDAKVLDDPAVAILLNHIVASQSTKPLTIISSVVDKNRITEIRGLRSGEPSWFYTVEQIGPVWRSKLKYYALSFPDLFLSYNNNWSGAGTITMHEHAENILKAHRQQTKISILNYRVDEKDHSCALQLRMEATLCRYERGALCNCIPIPGKQIKKKQGDPVEPHGVYSPEVVISSPVVEQAIKSLSDIWQDRASAVLVSGPPGSGKENFALSIPYGSGRECSEEQEKGQVPTVSLANGKKEEQLRQIFGYQQADGSIVHGLLAKAKGSAVFIDEAHYPLNKPGIRASLLRALEAKEYYPVGSLDLLKVENVQWIFASSLPLDGGERSLANVPPPDFWTRMTHVVRIEHPLDLKAYLLSGVVGCENISQKQREVLRDLFKFFWWDCAKAHFGIDPVRVLSSQKSVKAKDTETSERLIRSYLETILKENRINVIAEMFADAMLTSVGSQTLTEVSIRGLRSMISRLFSRCVGLVTSGGNKKYGSIFAATSIWYDTAKPEDKPNEIENEEKDVREEVFQVIREIQQIARLKT